MVRECEVCGIAMPECGKKMKLQKMLMLALRDFSVSDVKTSEV